MFVILMLLLLTKKVRYTSQYRTRLAPFQNVRTMSSYNLYYCLFIGKQFQYNSPRTDVHIYGVFGCDIARFEHFHYMCLS